MKASRSAYTVLARKLERNIALRRPKRRWEYNRPIKMDVREVGLGWYGLD
jgi:hypothetical protein